MTTDMQNKDGELIQYDERCVENDSAVPTGLVAEISASPGTEVPGYSRASNGTPPIQNDVMCP